MDDTSTTQPQPGQTVQPGGDAPSVDPTQTPSTDQPVEQPAPAEPAAAPDQPAPADPAAAPTDAPSDGTPPADPGVPA